MNEPDSQIAFRFFWWKPTIMHTYCLEPLVANSAEHHDHEADAIGTELGSNLKHARPWGLAMGKHAGGESRGEVGSNEFASNPNHRNRNRQ